MRFLLLEDQVQLQGWFNAAVRSVAIAPAPLSR